MKIMITALTEIKKDNPQLCLSPLREFAECHLCEHFKRGLWRNKEDIQKTLKMKCHPQIKENLIELFERKRELLKELNEINKQLEG